ncbi:AAA family ATPase [Streptomyces chartreusis]|uniref:AAA family ATPase n=1 Tax=Streptomyces chartreusis TaxID=1969 RepID=UPI00123E0056|nr:MoxR family ATPase [Streptomyces chartreusis]QEV66616.1 MoxR family ATPase [Streptomyces chartreusis]GGX02017.1 ATPase AAA [Streptomyces chartreusis]
MKDWWIYKGDRAVPTQRHLARLAEHRPPWRVFEGEIDPGHIVPSLDDERYAADRERGAGYLADDNEIDLVNTALLLRRPLLVTGVPGVGKSTLAYSIAQDLGLGPVLRWPITSRATLRDGLYRYDALRRLEDANLARMRAAPDESPEADEGDRETEEERPSDRKAAADGIGRYLRLGPLGTAFLPAERPRVLLVDEIDKCDIDLPGDLLTVLDEGRFDIPELARLADHQQTMTVGTDDPGVRVRITAGQVQCRAFPVVVLTSNGEREFPPAFLRRCIRLTIDLPEEEKLLRIIERRIGPDAVATATGPDGLIRTFLSRRERGELGTDQLLNAVQLRLAGAWTAPEEIKQLADATLQPLSGPDAT